MNELCFCSIFIEMLAEVFGRLILLLSTLLDVAIVIIFLVELLEVLIADQITGDDLLVALLARVVHFAH